jgi:hypothetical protein
MPAFDGTGPKGRGPLTGRGEGYCAIRLPNSRSGQVPYGYAGKIGVPVRLGRAPGQGQRRGTRCQRLLRRRR